MDQEEVIINNDGVQDPTIQDQLSLMYQMTYLVFDDLFDEYKELKIKVIKNAMLIIERQQKSILKAARESKE